MGQNRTDTFIQIQAKQRVADKLRCPACNRRSALSTKFEHMDGYRRIGSFRTCRYCGHEVGFKHGRSYGRPADAIEAVFPTIGEKTDG